jgi:hypothetical protein
MQPIEFAMVPKEEQEKMHDDDVAAEKTKPPPPLLISAPPPWHSVALVVAQFSFFLKIAPSLTSLDEIATLETLTHRIFPDIITIRTLGCLRAIMAVVIWATSIYTVMLDPNGFEGDTSYFPRSKLRKATFHLRGWKSLVPFTHLSWILLGLAFSLNSAVCFCFDVDGDHHHDAVFSWTKRLALIMWEIAAPAAFLTSIVVTYVIIPGAIRKSKVNGNELGDLDLFQPRTLLMHNANIFFCFVEICLLGGLPVIISHVALAPLYGIFYVIIVWNTTTIYTDVEKDGPQFLYNFLDTTLGKTTTIALLALLVVLMVGYLVMSKVLDFLESMGGGMFVHFLATITLSWVTCRMRP